MHELQNNATINFYYKLSYFECKIEKKLKRFFNNRNAEIKIQVHEQELELTEKPHVLPQDVSIALDFLDQEDQELHTLPKKFD